MVIPERGEGKNLLDRLTFFQITQAVLSLLIVVGGGIIFLNEPESREAVVGVVGVIVGYFFNVSNKQSIESRG